MVSKELLSKVLGEDIVRICDIKENHIFYKIPDLLNPEVEANSTLCENLDSITRLCKEFACRDTRLMIIDHHGTTCSFIELKNIDTSEIVFSTHGQALEAVVEAAEWISIQVAGKD